MVESLKSVNIVLGRVDDKLLHGRVGVIWEKHCKATVILVVDDEIFLDIAQQTSISKLVQPYGTKIIYWSFQQTLLSINLLSNERILLIVKNPIIMNELVQAGLPIKKVNLGNMHRSIRKKKLANDYIFVDNRDIEAIKAMKDKGVVITANILPTENEVIL